MCFIECTHKKNVLIHNYIMQYFGFSGKPINKYFLDLILEFRQFQYLTLYYRHRVTVHIDIHTDLLRDRPKYRSI